MNRTITSAIAIACMGLAMSAVAQPSESQMKDNADTQQRMANGDHDVRKDQKEYYKSLDRNNKGYLNSDDVSADPFLSQNYIKCDVDHDGKLTWEEFHTCTKNNPPPK